MNGLVIPEGNYKHRGLTQDIFGMSEIAECFNNPYFGSGFVDDFEGGADARYVKTNLNSATATLTQLAARHGVVRLDPGAVTDNHGCQVQFGSGSLQMSTDNLVVWETLVRLSTISTIPQALIGLAELDSTVVGASGAIAVDDFIGFTMDGADLNLDFVVRVGGVSNILKTSVAAAVDAAWMHLGFVVEQGKRFIPFVNHYRLDEQIEVSAAAMPTEPLAPTWAVVAAGTVRPTLDVDWHAGADSYGADVR